jgi:hypothetical protein
MPLSRHFYSLDEVQSSLYYTSSRSQSNETLFWCQELLLSGCIGETISTLFESWIWNTGPFHLNWLLHASKTLSSSELSIDDILLSAYQLSSSTSRDHSLWNILVHHIKDPTIPDRVTRKSPPQFPSNDPKEIYFIRSIFQGKTQSAYWISHYIHSEQVWYLLNWYSTELCAEYSTYYKECFEIFQNYERLLGYRSDSYDKVMLCLAIMSVCLSNNNKKNSFQSLPLELSPSSSIFLKELSPHIGYSTYRKYTIPILCLYGTTSRGCSQWSQNNKNQLYQVENYLLGCPFWEEEIVEYGRIIEREKDKEKEIKEIEWESEEKMEEFYEKYFPDDIPDEWTKQEKDKSHGDGVLGPRDQINLYHYSKKYLSKRSRMAWNKIKSTQKYLEQHTISECHPTAIFSLPSLLPPLIESILLPVHKKFIFI